MALFFWNAMLETGNDKIDQDHRKLFDMTNAIAALVNSGGPPPEVAALICELKLYAASHFQEEEKLATCSSLSSDQQAHHVHAHQEFLKRILEIEQQNYPSDIDAVSNLLSFLITWLVTHILRLDYQLAEALPKAAHQHHDRLTPEHVLISALVEAEKRFRLIAEEAPTMIWLCGPSGKREFVNRAWVEFAGWSALPANALDWDDLVHPADRFRHACFCADRVASLTGGTIEYRAMKANGAWGWISERIVPRMDGANCLGLLSIAIDISDVREAQHFLSDISEVVEKEVTERTKQLEVLASADPLTGLANRRTFLGTLDRATRHAHFSGEPLSILYIDVDHFKRVNDGFGHAAGDDVLVSTARTLEKHFRKTDILSRLGGDEFVVILPGTTQRDAKRLSTKLKSAIRSLTFQQFPESISISVGIATLDEGNTPEGLLHCADMALLFEKKTALPPTKPANLKEIPKRR